MKIIYFANVKELIGKDSEFIKINKPLKIREIIEADYQVESDLRRKVSLNIKRLSEINCTRGKRHRQQLPLRGQRTRTNARSRRGAKKTVAGKKK